MTGEEREQYMSELSEIVQGLINEVVSLADKYNVDRDNAMAHTSNLISAMVEIGTFQKYRE